MANQVVSVGIPKVVTTGSAQLVLPRSGQMLGFFSSATQAISFYDAASTSGLPTAFATITACAVGWNPFPCELVNGLVINCASQCTAVVV